MKVFKYQQFETRSGEGLFFQVKYSLVSGDFKTLGREDTERNQSYTRGICLKCLLPPRHRTTLPGRVDQETEGLD